VEEHVMDLNLDLDLDLGLNLIFDLTCAVISQTFVSRLRVFC